MANGRAPQEADADSPIEPAKVELGRPVDFTRDIYPILEKNCVSCHNVSVKEGDFVAENVTEHSRGGDSGPAVVAEKPDESLLYLYATRSEEPYMPPLPNQVGARALTGQEVGLITAMDRGGSQARDRPQQPAPVWQPCPGAYQVDSGCRSVALESIRRLGTREPDLRLRPARRRGCPTLGRSKPGCDRSGRHAMYPGGAAHRDLVHSLAFSPDGTLLASGGYRVVKLWQRAPNVRRSELVTVVQRLGAGRQ